MTDSIAVDTHKNILVLARNNPVEAMRVAAGLTIVGHEVELVFMHSELSEAEAGSEQGELLELCDIEPHTTVIAMQEHFNFLDKNALAILLQKSRMVINL